MQGKNINMTPTLHEPMTDSGASRCGTYDKDTFEKAFQAVLQMEKRDYPSFIGGLMVASGMDYRICSPIDDSVCFGNFQEPETGISDAAAEIADRAFPAWSNKSAEERAAILGKALEAIRPQRYRLAAAVLISTGMTKEESVAEVDAFIGIMEAACVDAVKTKKKPTGAWAVIAAHNSPLASTMGHAVAAMAAGNTVVIIPSKHAPLPAFLTYEIIARAGIPDGVLNLVIDRNDQSQVQLADDERIVGVVASGSGKIMEDMMFLHVDDELGFVNEVKGMNPILVYRPGDYKKAVRDLVDSAFRYSGQHLYSTSKVILTIDDQSKFMDLLQEQVKELTISDPAEDGTFAGPLISKDRAAEFERILKEKAGSVIYGGKRVKDELTQNGYYYTPAVMIGLDDEDDLAYMDTGLPLLYIKVVSGLDEAFEEIVYTECGLSAGIYSKDPKVIDRFKKEVECPVIFVNESSHTLSPGISAKVGNFVR